MKANELMIGDWVCTEHDSTPRQIDWIRTGEVGLLWNKVVTPPYLVPIPLSPEILEKNGFKFDGTNKWESHESGFDAFVVPVQPDNEWWDKYSTRIEVCTRRADLLIEAVDQIFVHQLQQFLRLCGIEKEINV